MKRKSLLMNVLVAIAVLAVSGFIGVQSSMAVEEHHQSGAAEKMPTSMESSGSGKMSGSASGDGPGMMGMMAGPDDAGGQGMMGMMDQGMMRMMMSHMMGGPGGMGKMMGKMGAGMKGPGGGPRGMAQMARMLEELNLTPEQWDQVRGLARERLEKMADLWAQRMKLQIELAGLRWDQQVNPQQVKEAFVKEAEAKAEMFLTSLDYLRKLKGVLNQEQLKNWMLRDYKQPPLHRKSMAFKKVKALSERTAELRSKLDRKHDEYLIQCRQAFGDRGWACPGGGRWGY